MIKTLLTMLYVNAKPVLFEKWSDKLVRSILTIE